MPSRDPRIWMWAEALDMMDKAERMRRQFFQPGAPGNPGAARRPTWQPPVDLIETADEYLVVVALPGVRPDQVQVVIDGGVLIVVGERALPVGDRAGLIHRMEIPHGRFERHIELPPGPLELGRRELADGCLVLSLHKAG
ncbi:Hsp20/alpha crystallin family protein [Skermanella pratensis]|uniref:Hsp20/alpha crystallin family protein n=1 Tax=Skermanella pratensis TaxID=2233999 RepID=UPI001300FDB8|nr:Hsp20/alpha crystallin family protein [Skermanella pratensis]